MRPLVWISTLFTFLLQAPGVSARPPEPPRIHRYASSELSYGANAYWLESAQGIVLIDALMLHSDAAALAAPIKSRKKPLAGHPHVDHFGGLRTLREAFPKAPIFATRATAGEVQATHERAYEQGWIQAYGEDYRREVLVPDSIIESTAELNLAGIKFAITSFGAMEAADNVLVQNLDTGALFTGDAVLNGHCYYLGDGHSASALAGLEEIGLKYPPGTRAYPAHGDPGRLGAMLARDIGQVRYMRERVIEIAQRAEARTRDGRLSDAARTLLIGMFTEHFSDWLNYGLGSETIARMNLAGLEPEILRELDHAKPASAPPQ